jgi:hypothetical protein
MSEIFDKDSTIKNKKQTKGLKRNSIDKFYTKKDIAEKCTNLMSEYLTISKNDLIIEPSAGNGSFIPYIKKIVNNYMFYDIEPDNEEVIKQDYLKLDYTLLKKNNKTIHLIGNPPFGRQSSTTIKFVKKSCEYCDSISFILPRSFKKESMKKYFNDYFHVIYEMDLPDKSFLVNDIEHDVPCVFQIWKKENYKRITIDKILPLNFEFVKKIETPDISFRRVGVYAGNISKDIENKSEQSHYFIKFLNGKTIDCNIDLIKKIKFNSNNTVGPKSISKQELIKEFNSFL